MKKLLITQILIRALNLGTIGTRLPTSDGAAVASFGLFGAFEDSELRRSQIWNIARANRASMRLS